MNLRKIISQTVLSLTVILSVSAADKTPDVQKDFTVKLPAEKKPFPQPLAPGEQPGFKFRGTKGWAWTPEQYLAEIPWLVKFKMNFLMNCYTSMFDLEHHPNWWTDHEANRWWEEFPAAKKKPTKMWCANARGRASNFVSA